MMEHNHDDEMPPAYSPQNIADLLPIYRPNENDNHIHTYLLQQGPNATQILYPGDSASTPPVFHVKTFKTGGFMNRKPHIAISRAPEDKIPFAEARFDIHGTGTTVSYTEPACTQRLELEDSRLQLLKTNIGGHSLWWQPFPGNKDVIELTNDLDEILARFVCTSPPSLLAQSSKKRFVPVDLGKLHIVDVLVDSNETRMAILCSAIVVVERAKRRAAILNNKASAYGVARSLSGSSANYIPQ